MRLGCVLLLAVAKSRWDTGVQNLAGQGLSTGARVQQKLGRAAIPKERRGEVQEEGREGSRETLRELPHSLIGSSATSASSGPDPFYYFIDSSC